MEIIIYSQKEKDNGWEITIHLDGTEFLVFLDKDYWLELTEEKKKPEELVVDSFKFLLDREPKEAILREFNLKEIKRFFPEYEKEIRS